MTTADEMPDFPRTWLDDPGPVRLRKRGPDEVVEQYMLKIAELVAELAEARAENEELRVERDVSRAISDKLVMKFNGGEWTTAYGDSDPRAPTNPHAVEWCEVPGCDNEDCGHDRQRRVWYGPIEAVGDDEIDKH